MTPGKYPRTYHLPYSPGVTGDDKVIPDTAVFHDDEVVVTEKHDGENTTMTSASCYARSLDSVSHFSRDWVRAFWSTLRHEIPAGWRFCGENLWARHAIAYDSLPSFFLGFSVWDSPTTALSWDDGVQFMEMLGITPVPVIYRGIWSKAKIDAAFQAYCATLDHECEGYVVRTTGGLQAVDTDNGAFLVPAAKWVRAGHVNEDAGHWLHGGTEIKQNRMALS